MSLPSSGSALPLSLETALATFVEEAQGLLQEMETLLVVAEAGAADSEAVNALFRAAHTIKGSAGLFGLDDVVAFTHGVESVLDRVRTGELTITGELTGLLLWCRDHIETLVSYGHRRLPLTPELRAQGVRLSAHLQALDAPGGAVVEAVGQVETLADEPADPAGLWHLSLGFGADVLRNGMDPLSFIRYLSHLGQLLQVDVVAQALPDFDEMDPERCYLGFEVDLQSAASKADIEAVFEFVREDATIRITPPLSRIDDYVAAIGNQPQDPSRLGEILVRSGAVTAAELDAALHQQNTRHPTPLLGEVLVEQGAAAEPVVMAALHKQKKSDDKKAQESRSIKVAADRLDHLINLVGEFVIAGAATHMQAGRSRLPELIESSTHLMNLVEEIRDGALRLRMVPIGEVFSRFPRVVRDIAMELGKNIELVIKGADTELDKTMVELIGDPLMHLVRNALDHGIEAPAVRAAQGKPEKGTLTLSAYHESGSFYIEVRDDGSGLNRDRILQKAIERGLVSPGQNLSERDIHRLVMEPGFSTADQVTNLSGRGVGMDVVRSNVEALRGTLDITSTPGQGACMRICLPLTLAIIDGFLVRVADSAFIAPLDMVIECIELPVELARGAESDFIELRGVALPFVRLRELFQIEGEPPQQQNIVVVQFAGTRLGLVVDSLMGEHQTVIKPLGRLLNKVKCVSGATILGTGEIAFIVDVPQLALRARSRARPEQGLVLSTASEHGRREMAPSA